MKWTVLVVGHLLALVTACGSPRGSQHGNAGGYDMPPGVGGY